MTFEELYKNVLRDKLQGRQLEKIPEKKLECLLHPEKYPLVWRQEPCDCHDAKCVTACMFRAMEIRDGVVTLNPDNCVGCAQCIQACEKKNLTFSKDAIRAVDLLKESEEPIYALMAPAYIGQFGEEATPEKLRSALKAIGFAGMIEVAAFADILTLKESLEFCHHIKKTHDFQLTSCCCPIWISMIRKDFPKIVGHLPASVSPMIACGRIVKALHKNCKTIFIGPCLAKKAEIREPDLVGDIDLVLTFQELQDILEVLQIDFGEMEEDISEHAAKAGRMYAKAGGVSQAVKECVMSIDSNCELEPVCACGVSACKKMLEDILQGHREGNFFEGMACPGGCVGGPKRNLDLEEATKLVDNYANQAKYRTPGENPYVLELIRRLGFHTVEEFISNSTILNRNWEKR